MRSSFVIVFGALGVLSLVGGCTKSRTSSVPADVTAPVASSQASTSLQAMKDEAPPKTRRKPGTAGVFVDGRAVGVLKVPELPAAAPGRKIKLGVNKEFEVTRYPFTEYFKAVGVDVAKIKAVHFYGGSRVAILTGDEVRRTAENLTFSFTMNTRGKPRMHMPSEAKYNTTVDMLSRVAVYVDKAPPTLDEDGEVVLDGKVVEGVPYAATGESTLGTRVYLDGKLVGSVRRRSLPNKFLVAHEPGKPARFSVAQYAESLGVDLSKAKAVDVVSGDEVVGRLDGAKAKDLAFTVPNHTHGSMLVDVGSVTTKVSALEFFTKAPPARTMSEPEAFDPADPDGNADDPNSN